ncbi:redox-sensing transcriptional repressor Rex [Kitasatospora sp. GAS204B]|uniref:redox-sensing transcriptional repressor Rex n=1 Tax=unclassified Kitasatospora TaxID=2633591 RepID=UPI002477025E|nr:redox-sensing transcriptional repressor Rex [Kitasatospora sp. GAS204B]MDH6121328.1 redox-sensing transcriptional repressor [Kitasatospora sp. GAS204B]
MRRTPVGRQTRARGIPEATVARLPLYLRALTALSERSVPTVSSEELAAAAGVNSAKLRKDFSYLGSYGTRGVGYDVEYLVYQISRELGLTQDWPVVIVGIGNLGHALANYGGFASRGFRVAALLDADPAVVGSSAAGLPVRHMDELESIVESQQVSIGVITTPPGAAQQVCDRLVEAGVTSILNFAPTVLTVPDGVDVRKVDLSIELQILAFHEQRKAGEEPEDEREEEPAPSRAANPVRAAAAKLRRAAGGSAKPEAKPEKTDKAQKSAAGNDHERPAVMPA